jgi:hypothetical protein
MNKEERRKKNQGDTKETEGVVMWFQSILHINQSDGGRERKKSGEKRGRRGKAFGTATVVLKYVELLQGKKFDVKGTAPENEPDSPHLRRSFDTEIRGGPVFCR